MDINQIRFGMRSADIKKITSSKSRLCIILSLLIAFTSFTAFASSQLKSYTVIDGNKSFEVITSAVGAAEIVKSTEINFSDYDIAQFVSDNTISITRRCAVTVSVHGIKRLFVVAPDTVKNILSTLGIKPDKKDVVTPSENTVVSGIKTISVDMVEYETEKSEKIVEYKEYKSMLKQDGKKDELKKCEYVAVSSTYTKKYVNGRKQSSKLTDRSYSKVNTSAYTNVKSASVLTPEKEIKLDKNGVPVSYSKVIKGRGTAYCTKGYTASGRYVKQGYIAVNPNVIPYGTKLYIRTPDNSYIYGYAVAADTGGFTQWGTVVADLYLDSYQDCINFGVRNIEIYVLK